MPRRSTCNTVGRLAFFEKGWDCLHQSITTPACSLFSCVAAAPWWLAAQQQGQAGQISLEQGVAILINLGLLVLAVIVLIVVAMFVRKWLGRNELTDQVGGSDQFTMNQLRQMHSQGQLSDDEFDRAKRLLIARSKAMLDEPAAPPSITPQPDENPPLRDDNPPGKAEHPGR